MKMSLHVFRRLRVSMSVLRVPFDRVRPLVSSYTFDSVPTFACVLLYIRQCSAVCVCPPMDKSDPVSQKTGGKLAQGRRVWEVVPFYINCFTLYMWSFLHLRLGL